MNSDDRFSFLLMALVAAAVILGTSQMGRPRGAGLPDAPLLGSARHEMTMGPVLPPEEAPEPEPRAAASALAERRVLEILASNPWPDFVRHVVLHPMAATALEGGSPEQGPPYHLVVEADGSVRWTERGTAGGASQPEGLPVSVATKAFHVAMPDARRVTPERLAAARVLWVEATRRLGDRAVLFADEVAGSSVRLPEGFDRDAYVPQSETRPKESRPGSTATQPSAMKDRVKVRFGSGTIDAGVANAFAARAEGFMGRTSLRKDEGLLFLYATAEHRSFWMKGCLVPLDVLYLADDGTVLAIGTLDPPDPRIPGAEPARFVSPSPCRLVLEVEGGNARARGVTKGSRLGLPPNIQQLLAKAEP